MTNAKHIATAVAWLERAQDTTRDGGVAAWFSLVSGWRPSYIETTGYIINTFLDCAEYLQDKTLVVRAIKMADFLLEMQLESGGYRTAVPSVKEISEPTVFNTGQDLLGLSAIYSHTKNKKYLDSCVRASDFLCEIQGLDGSWVQNTYGSTKHTYHTRVALGLLKVHQISGKIRYKTAAIKNLDWAIGNQLENGWFSYNQLPPPNISVPYTHTIAYAIEGLFWSGKLLKNKKYINAAQKGALHLAKYYLKHNFLPGTFDQNWHSSDKYSCLTGDAQISLIWAELYNLTNNEIYARAAKRMNKYLRSIQRLRSPLSGIRGAIPGSSPLWGDILRNTGYCRLAYLNWATKFYIDALLAEEKYLTK